MKASMTEKKQSGKKRQIESKNGRKRTATEDQRVEQKLMS
jgi:hypothetical protein